mgnify:FL=1
MTAIAGRRYRFCLVERRAWFDSPSDTTCCGDAITSKLWDTNNTWYAIEDYHNLEWVDEYIRDDQRICPACEKVFYARRDSEKWNPSAKRRRAQKKVLDKGC